MVDVTTSLPKGANAPLPSSTVRAVLTWRPGPATPDIDATALLTTADGKVRGDHDMVFYNAQRHPDGAVRHLGKSRGPDQRVSDVLEVDLQSLTADVDRVALTAAVDGGTFGQVTGLVLDVVDVAGQVLARCLLSGSVETAMVAAELYRRAGGWKVRHVSQGWDSGLAGLAADFGVDVDVDVDELIPAAGPSPHPLAPPAGVPGGTATAPVVPGALGAPAPSAPALGAAGGPQPSGGSPVGPVRFTSGEEQLPPSMRKKLNLRKQQVAVSLAKAGGGQIRARVILVLDASGSMTPLYSKGVVADVVERMAAVSAQLDDDGTMQAWTFASNPARLPDLELADLPTWITLHVRVGELKIFRSKATPRDGQVDMAQVGIQNEEQKVIAQVREYVQANPASEPTLVLFFSDGGVYRNGAIEKQLRAAVQEPIFWQFVGLGNAGFGVLEKFDTMGGRLVDNTGFFKVGDIAKEKDADLYDKLLSEFPSYVRDARAAGVLRG